MTLLLGQFLSGQVMFDALHGLLNAETDRRLVPGKNNGLFRFGELEVLRGSNCNQQVQCCTDPFDRGRRYGN
ncbi:hypothetical protein CPA46_12195 [Sphingopyxis terrae subsp. ummariensis]|nr:hypothetical protein CPA46_12195 [Sphingopyxis terrae subsp. ummariensis]